MRSKADKRISFWLLFENLDDRSLFDLVFVEKFLKDRRFEDA
jgi:hypothetical protein